MPNPKSCKTLVPVTAKKLKVSEELVNDVVDFFYKELINKLKTMDDIKLRVPIIGSFRVQNKKIERSIKKLTEILNNKDPYEFHDVKLNKKYSDLLKTYVSVYDKIKKLENEKNKHREYFRKP